MKSKIGVKAALLGVPFLTALMMGCVTYPTRVRSHRTTSRRENSRRGRRQLRAIHRYQHPLGHGLYKGGRRDGHRHRPSRGQAQVELKSTNLGQRRYPLDNGFRFSRIHSL